MCAIVLVAYINEFLFFYDPLANAKMLKKMALFCKFDASYHLWSAYEGGQLNFILSFRDLGTLYCDFYSTKFDRTEV